MTMQPAALLAAIVESSDDAIVAKDLNGRVMVWNAAAEQLFGYHASEAIGQHITFIIPADRLDEETFVMRRVTEGTGIADFETVRRRKDGTYVDVSLTVSPVRDESGNIVGASKIARDITQQKLATARLEEERRIVETLDRIGGLLTGTLDRDRIVRVITEVAAELSGARYGAFRYHAAPGRALRDSVFTLPGTHADTFVHLPRATIDVPFGSEGQELGVLRHDNLEADTPGAMRSCLSVPVVSRSGTAIGRVFLGHDAPGAFSAQHQRLITGTAKWGALALENAQLYLEAQQANRQKDEFLATLSHELRTPLNAIMGWAQILGSAVVDERSRARAISTIQRNARAQARLIDDLLDVSRIVAGKLVLRSEAVELKSVIAMALEDIRPSAAERQIELRADIEEVDAVTGDAPRLQQVVWNLLSNAVKFTPPKGIVAVSLRRVAQTVEMSVSDTGQGIPPELLTHVFDRFQQGDASATRRHGGLGLGLGIVKHLTEAHGGRVQAFSDGVGHGARFVVSLPVRAVTENGRRGSDTGRAMGEASLAGIRVLAVDDERDAADMLTLALRIAGADVVTAYGARDALACAEGTGFDVVLADIGMPDMDGCALIHELRDRPTERPFLGVAVTAYASASDRTRALEAGFDLHLAKPMPPEDVVAAIARALAH